MFEVDVKSMELDPMCLLLALPDGHIVNVKHKSLVHLLTFAARKNILVLWIRDPLWLKISDLQAHSSELWSGGF